MKISKTLRLYATEDGGELTLGKPKVSLLGGVRNFFFCREEVDELFPETREAKVLDLEIVNGDVRGKDWTSVDPVEITTYFNALKGEYVVEAEWGMVVVGKKNSIRDIEYSAKRVLEKISPEGSTVYIRWWIVR